MMKLAITALLVASAAAFAPSSQQRVSYIECVKMVLSDLDNLRTQGDDSTSVQSDAWSHDIFFENR